tara:strand:+ start:192 stop:602 length:411 start_codon:yes stop_codon:yes gene_type:complete
MSDFNMNILRSLNQNIKNIFVGSHKGDDIKDEWINPLDTMPMANGTNRYAPAAKRKELEGEINPRPEEEVAEWFMENPDESDKIEEEKKTIHQKMYEIATAQYNPFAIGGSENLGGGSEKRLEEEFTPENDPYGGY